MTASLAASFSGYEGDRPVHPPECEPEHLEATARSYRRLLSQVGREVGGGPFTPYLELHAERVVNWCGRGHGFTRACPNGHEWFTPIGCGYSWCLRCAGLLADDRARRIHYDLCRVGAASRRAVVCRAVFTLHPDHWPHARTRAGSAQAQGRAVTALCRTLGVDRRNLAVWSTYHPTSTKRPWRSFPHFEVVWLHASVSEDEGVQPLEWHSRRNGQPIEAAKLRDAWARPYPGSVNLEVSWFRWTGASNDYAERQQGRAPNHLRSYTRYALRPFPEDVWHALRARPVPRLWTVVGDEWSLDENLCRASEPDGGKADPDEVRDGLDAEGGVTLWKGYHRVRRFGWLRSAGFQSRQAALETAQRIQRTTSEDDCACGLCPACEEPLKVELAADGRAILSRPQYDFDRAVVHVLADGSTFEGVTA